MEPGKRAILIVEDERIFAKDLQYTLTALGYEVIGIASSGPQALARAEQRRPDLVLMDIRIQGPMDGIATAEQMRLQFRVPVIYMSAHADERTLERARLTEPYGYLVKPINPASLRTSIEVSLFKHELERTSRERERWLGTVLNSIGDGVVLVDLQGRITFMNPGAEQLTGWSAEQAAERPVHEVVSLCPHGSCDPAAAPLDAVIGQGCTHRAPEIDLVTRAGVRTVSNSIAPVIADGVRLGAVMVLRDVTEQKTQQRKLELSDRLVSLGTMAAGLAHEVNNPLVAVLSNVEFALSVLRGRASGSADLGSVTEALGELEEGARRIARIVSDLRAFSRPRPEVPEVADVRPAVEWALRTLAADAASCARIQLQIADPLPLVAGDAARLGQLFVNLLRNALQSFEPERPARECEIAVRAQLLGADQVMVEIRDSGCGMAEEQMRHIFDPFFTTKPVGAGTGLGLSICHGIVAAMGGEIEVSSRPGEGTSVRLFLPVARQRTVEVRPAAAAEPVTRTARVLVIDDDALVLRAVQRILQEHSVKAFAKAQEALELLEAGEPFDAILCDVFMPEMTGSQFFERLLRSSPEDAARVIFMTGGVMTPSVDAFLSSVPNPVIEKPIDVKALRSLIQELKSARDAARGALRTGSR